MRNIQLQLSFLFLFTWKLFVVVGNAYPIIDLNNEENVKNNIIKKNANISIQDAVVSTTTYSCVHIPSNLDPCKFSYDKIKENRHLKRTLTEKGKHELSKSNTKSNKIFYAHASPMRLKETDKHINTIIYEILRCVPPRLPFILPRCTDKDLANEKSEIQRLYPFKPDADFPKAAYQFPMYNFSHNLD